VTARKKFYSYQPAAYSSLNICLSPWERKAYLVALYPALFNPVFMVMDVSKAIYAAVKGGKGENLGRMEFEYNNESLKNIFDIPLVQMFVPSDNYKSSV
jgi:hypothetical protein